MCALSTSELLGAWERGLGQPPAVKALTLLAATDSARSTELLAKLCIGRRDQQLLSLREELFGPEFTCLTACPDCGERIEFVFMARDLRQTSDAQPPDVLSVLVDDWQVEFRLPNSEDLLKIADVIDISAARATLIELCTLEALTGGQTQAANELPERVVSAIIEKMSESDPQANVQLSLSCPACAIQWQARFDIAGFLWTEINAWARRTLREVDALARVYGWREADILALSSRRRQVYLEMIN